MKKRLMQLWNAVKPSAKISIGGNSRVKRWRLSLDKNSSLTVGRDSIVDARIISDRAGSRFIVGDRTSIGNSLLVAAERIEIGDDVLMSWGITVVDHNSHSLDFARRKDDVIQWGKGLKEWTHVKISPVKIGNKVWIGFGVTILKGVEIGEGAVVAASAVVTKNVAPWTVVAGNPAVAIRNLEPWQGDEPAAIDSLRLDADGPAAS